MYSGRTKVCGIIGNPIQHSLSPFLHNLAGASLGEELLYAPFPVEEDRLFDAVTGLRALGVLGANVTIPYKEAVLPLLDQVDDHARAIGAVNTIANQQGMLHGFNTDWIGFSRSLEEKGYAMAGEHALILGAGGAARAVIYSLLQGGIASVRLAARTRDRAEALQEHFADPRVTVIDTTNEDLDQAIINVSLIVNATPLGLRPDDPLPLHREAELGPEHLLVDLLYEPARTRFLALGEARGSRTLNGFPMLVYQAWESLAIWTGKHPGESFRPHHVARLLPRIHQHEEPREPAAAPETPFTLEWEELARRLGNRLLFLVGFMGAGKTTIGRILSECLGRSFIDTDARVKADAGMSIPDIFETFGEATFRRMEQDAFFAAIQEPGSVIALGGGGYVQPTIHRACRNMGVSIWLKADLDAIEARLKGDTGRPLWQNRERIRGLYETRLPFYGRADVHVPAAGTIEVTLEEIRYRLADTLTTQPVGDVAAWKGAAE